MLKSIVVTEPRLRVLNRLARVQLTAGQQEEALGSIERILSLNSKHTAANRLKERIQGGKTVALLPAQNNADGTDSEEPSDSSGAKTSSVPPQERSGESKNEKEASPQKLADMGVYQLLRKASTAQRGDRPTEAVTLFNLALEKEPGNIEALNGLGHTHLQMGVHGAAIAKFNRALSQNPGFGPSLIGMAKTYKRMNRGAEALKWFEKYIASNPNGRHAEVARKNIEELKSATPEGKEPESSDIPGKVAGDADSSAEERATDADALPSGSAAAESPADDAEDDGNTVPDKASEPAEAPASPPPVPKEEPVESVRETM